MHNRTSSYVIFGMYIPVCMLFHVMNTKENSFLILSEDSLRHSFLILIPISILFLSICRIYQNTSLFQTDGQWIERCVVERWKWSTQVPFYSVHEFFRWWLSYFNVWSIMMNIYSQLSLAEISKLYSRVHLFRLYCRLLRFCSGEFEIFLESWIGMYAFSGLFHDDSSLSLELTWNSLLNNTCSFSWFALFSHFVNCTVHVFEINRLCNEQYPGIGRMVWIIGHRLKNGFLTVCFAFGYFDWWYIRILAGSTDHKDDI